MEDKKSIYYTVISVAIFCVLALVVGILIFYFVSPDIKDIPKNVEVEFFDGEYHLVTDAKSGFSYCFVIEQEIDGEYIKVAEVEEKNNSTNLSKNEKITLQAGNKFRFKSAYTTENGRHGGYSEYFTYTITPLLDEVERFSFSEGILFWDSINNATLYEIKLISLDDEQNFSVSTNFYDFSTLEKGEYKVFVTAKAENFISSTSKPFKFTI